MLFLHNQTDSMAKKKPLKPSLNRVSLRKHRYVFTLNDSENKALNRYLGKYKIRNKSKLIRETLMLEVIRRLEQDSPTLFDDVM
jgi:hypothetical protein